jgi:SWI/SNF-related matrix-associated actin-dependent regulator of chromatin subfamily B protein 1
MANIEDHVIPIRLDIEHDHFRLRDTFMWNVSDTVITPEAFAVTICDDFGVSPNIYVPKIVAIINERVAEYRDQVAPAEQPCPSLKGHIDLENDDGKAMMDAFRRAQAEVGSDDDDESSPVSDDIRTEPGVDSDEHVKVVSWEDQRPGCGSGSGTTQDDRPMTVDELDALIDNKNVQEELRLLIKVEILIGNQNLTDTFEWDINSLVTPEEFAHSYCTELGLSGEFM